MKKILSSLLAVAFVTATGTSQAWWSDDDDYYRGGPWGHDWNPYDEWDPRYWVREMDNEMADDDWDKYGPMMYNRGYGGYPGVWGAPYGYAPPVAATPAAPATKSSE